MTGTARLGDDALELIDLLLGTDEGTELLNNVSNISSPNESVSDADLNR